MIQVRCSVCDQSFEADDSSAGQSEFCPFCGTLNDVPGAEGQELSDNAAIEPIATPPTSRRGGAILRGLGWMIALAAAGAFVVGCFYILRPDWESKHLVTIVESVNRGQAAMAAGDFAAAQEDYQSAIDEAGNRVIESDFLRDRLTAARRGLQEAIERKNAKPATAPTTASSTEPSVVPDEGQISTEQAVREFQRASEGFAQIAGSKPMLFLDDRNQWRQRRFVVYDVARELRLQADPPAVILRFTVAVRTTVPQDKKSDALAEGEFNIADSSGTIHCQTYFALRGNKWAIDRQERDEITTKPPWLDELYVIEEQVFAAR